jgi:hypothetical protein
VTSYGSSGGDRLIVVADEKGKIIAAVNLAEALGGEGITAVGINASQSQQLHEVALPDEPDRTEILEALDNHYVEIFEGQPRLARSPAR